MSSRIYYSLSVRQVRQNFKFFFSKISGFSVQIRLPLRIVKCRIVTQIVSLVLTKILLRISYTILMLWDPHIISSVSSLINSISKKKRTIMFIISIKHLQCYHYFNLNLETKIIWCFTRTPVTYWSFGEKSRSCCSMLLFEFIKSLHLKHLSGHVSSTLEFQNPYFPSCIPHTKNQ